MLLILFASLQVWAQSEGPYRESQATGNLSKPAQLEFSADRLKKLKAPDGVKIAVFAKDLKNPRMMVIGDDGAVYVSRPKSKDILVLRDKNGDGVADDTQTFVKDIEGAHGMAIEAGKLYFVALKKLYVADLAKPGAAPKLLRDDLPNVGQHENRSLAIGPDKMLYVAIASNCNSCVDPDKKMATMQRMKLDGTDMTTFADGLRDTIGFDWQPTTGELYGMDHGTDWRGDTIPPEEFNHIQLGKNYGWPFCWAARNPDPNLIDNPKDSTKEKFCPTTEAPLLTYNAHAAPIAMRFYKGEMFPELKGSALVAFHGSWNRAKAVGYNVVEVQFKDGKPTAMKDYLTGFLSANGREQFGRPSGIAYMKDGSILVSDDSAGMIYRLTK